MRYTSCSANIPCGPRRFARLLRVAGAVGLLVGGGALTPPTAALKPELRPRTYGQLPLVFEPNRGQTDSQVQFLARGAGYHLFLTGSEAVFAFRSGGVESPRRQRLSTGTTKRDAVPETKSATVRMQIVGGRTDPQGVALEPLRGTVNYLRGNNPEKWQTNVPTYGRVRYDDVYPGIDLVYYGNSRRLEYDFIVAPGASPDAITLGFEGADSVKVDGEGGLVLSTAGGPVRFEKPLVYQERGAQREPIAGEYVWKGTRRMGFRVAAYDATRPLIIDPVLSYSTYLGGSGVDGAGDIAVDATGAAYVTGVTESTDFPAMSPIQPTFKGGADAFVAKLTPDGTALVYATYLGGSEGDWGVGIAVDAAGAAYVAGETLSQDFPTKSPFQPALKGASNAFVAKLTADGTALVYATYLGGSTYETEVDIAADSTGAVYVTGTTQSIDFPIRSALQPTLKGGTDTFLAKLRPDGTELIYATYIGGGTDEEDPSIALDGTGAVYLTGGTTSTDFPVLSPLQSTLTGGRDAFVVKVTADGSALTYATYLGGSGYDSGYGIAVDSAGAAYVIGVTASTDFPTRSPLQSTLSGSMSDAFIAKLAPDGTALVHATYLGGTGEDVGYGIAVDSTGATYVTGATNARQPIYPNDFLIVHPVRTEGARREDTFVAKLAGDAILSYSITLGSDWSVESAIAVDPTGAAYVTGSTLSLSFPTVNPLQPALRGGTPGIPDAFVTRIASTSSDVPVQNVNGLVQLRQTEITTSFDPTPVSPEYPAGTLRIVAGFDNVSSVNICNPFFQVVELSFFDEPWRGNRLEAVSIEPAGTQIQGLSGYPVSHPPFVFGVGMTVQFEFVIDLLTTDLFRFFVNIWGTPQPAGSPCR